MSTSTTASNVNGDAPVPPWLKTVDRRMLYNAGGDDTTEDGPPADAPAPPLPNDATAGADSSSLLQELALAMTDPSDIPTPDPDLQPTMVGHVRADLDKQLEKAVSVLSSRYDATVSRSLILEFALQRTLVQVREQGEESPLVQWLDSVR